MNIRQRLGNAKVRVTRPLHWAANGLRWGPFSLMHAPIVIGNTMSKAGSNLIGQILRALPEIGPFMFTPWRKLNRGPGNTKLGVGATVKKVRSLMRGEVAYANMSARDEFVRLLTDPRMATIYVYRDPRDLVVSQMFYATEMYTGHALHALLANRLETIEERLDVFIGGLDDPAMYTPDVQKRYARYQGWLNCPEILAVRFEDLILQRRPTLAIILRHIENRGFIRTLPTEHCLDLMEHAIVPKKSRTFRRGQPGNWREYFTDQNKRHFKEVAGDLLIDLGYEQNNDW